MRKHCVIGLTGGIGSGKTSAANLFAKRGVRIIDTDAISHTLSKPPSPALLLISQTFGADFILPNGAMDRTRMRNHVFSDPHARAKLEAIFHPLIREEALRLINSPTTAPYTILMVPLLLENTTYREACQYTVAVDCSEALQIERVIARSALTREETLAIMSTQLQRHERLKLADYSLSNSGTLDDLDQQIAQLHQSFLNISNQMQE